MIDKADQFFRLQLNLHPVLPAREIAIAWLDGLGFSMFEDSEQGLVAFAKQSDLQEEGIQEVLTSLAEIAVVSVDKSWIKSENWNAQWEADFEPIDVVGKILMRAPFHAPPQTGLDIIIQPEMSFGTGHHPTTWQMMYGLLDLNLAGKSVLDVGCGTGVLAIAAKKMGASEVVAFDVDEWSHQNTLANLERNSLINQITTFQGSIKDLPKRFNSFDVILANINRNVLTSEMPLYSKYLMPGGSLLLSGFFQSDIEAVSLAAQNEGLELFQEQTREDWACLLLTKTNVRNTIS